MTPIILQFRTTKERSDWMDLLPFNTVCGNSPGWYGTPDVPGLAGISVLLERVILYPEEEAASQTR